MRLLSVCAALIAFYIAAPIPAFPQASRNKAVQSKTEKIVEPTFPFIQPGTLPLNLKVIPVVPAFEGAAFDLAKTPAMCLARLSALIDSAGGTEKIKQFSSDAKRLNISFQSYIGGEITLHCLENDGSGAPDRKLYSVALSIVTNRPEEFLDILHRVGAELYGWKAADLEARFVECTNKAKRNLQKDAFGVIPGYGSVKGMECYTTGKPKLVLYAPDVL